MNLRDVYITEVTSRLPESIRDDVALELESTIADMTGEDDTEPALFDALQQLGDPAVLAAGYANRPLHVVGPSVFLSYTNVLKTALPIAVTISTIVATIGYLSHPIAETAWIQFIIQGLLQIGGSVVNVVIQTVFWITLVFFLIERTGREQDIPFSKWTPERLRHVPSRTKEIKLGSIVFDFVMVAVLVMLYINANQFIRLSIDGETLPLLNADVLNRYFPLIVLLAAFATGIGIYKWVTRRWTKPLALWNVALNVTWIAVSAWILLQPALLSETALDLLYEQTAIRIDTLIQWGTWSILATILIVCLIDLAEGCIKAFRR